MAFTRAHLVDSLQACHMSVGVHRSLSAAAINICAVEGISLGREGAVGQLSWWWVRSIFWERV